jgi:hypothetical protein
MAVPRLQVYYKAHMVGFGAFVFFGTIHQPLLWCVIAPGEPPGSWCVPVGANSCMRSAWAEECDDTWSTSQKVDLAAIFPTQSRCMEFVFGAVWAAAVTAAHCANAPNCCPGSIRGRCRWEG